MVWWVPLAVAGAQMVGQLAQGKRSASDEVPGLAELIAQSTAGRRDAQMFSRAAVDPNSAWFKGLSGSLEENFINAAFRGMREKDIRDMRKMGRGIPISYITNSERRDEARYSAWIDALQGARMKANTITPELLLRAAQASSGASGVPGGALDIFKQYANENAARTGDIMDLGGTLLEGILKQATKGGSSTTSGGTPITDRLTLEWGGSQDVGDWR